MVQPILHKDGQPFRYQFTMFTVQLLCNLEMYVYYYIVHAQKTLYLHAHAAHNTSRDFNYLWCTCDVHAENARYSHDYATK